MELGLNGKHVIVTGGGTNIGRAIVNAFGAEGSKISIAELVPSQGEIVATEVVAMDSGAVVNVIPTDVTDPEKVATMIKTAIAEFGPVDVLVNNAAVDPRDPWDKITPDVWLLELCQRLHNCHTHGIRFSITSCVQESRGGNPVALTHHQLHCGNQLSVRFFPSGQGQPV